jgi:hypothetical protein
MVDDETKGLCGGSRGGGVVRVIKSRPDVQTALGIVVQHLLELIGERRGNRLQGLGREDEADYTGKTSTQSYDSATCL